VTRNDISDFVVANFPGLNVVNAWGEKSFFYNPDNLLKRGVYFLTLKEKDGDNDKASALDRENIFRINFGISKKTFSQHFSTLPKRPAKSHSIEGLYDFQKLNTLTPHPVYGWMAWVSILNPSNNSFEMLEKLIKESYQIACDKYLVRVKGLL